MSHIFVVTRDIPCIGVLPHSEPPSIPKGSMVTFVGSPAVNRVEVSWKGRSVTMLACDFAEKTEAMQRSAVAGFRS